jgi:hypothetical protein
MKRTLLLLLVLGFALNIYSYDKKSLVERFTNASCGPCADLNNAWYNATTQSLVNSGSISHIVYNVNWPGSSDPMYLLNSTDNMTRSSYYGVTWVPWPNINGVYFDFETMDQTQFVSAVNTGNGQYSPFKIVMTQRALSDDLVEIGVKILRDPNDNTAFGITKLRVGLTEKTVSFSSPPGSNGESRFFSICRNMIPDANGTTLTIPAPGDSIELILQYEPTTAFVQSVNMDSLRVVAYIQDETYKSIYQSSMFDLTRYFIAQTSSSPDLILENTTPAVFDAVLKNIGIMSDKYAINCTLNAPTGWVGEFTTSNGTFPFGTADSIDVAVGDSTIVHLNINLQGIDGFGKTTVVFESCNNPGMLESVTANIVTSSGNNILVVNAGDKEYSSYVTGSIENVYDGTFGYVSRSAIQQVNLSLSGFDIIVWQASNSTRAFYAEEIIKLQNYLDDGGKLLITGQDIGSDIFETSGQSHFAQDFYHNYLHTNYVADASSQNLIKGITNDIISNGLRYYANSIYQLSLDKISARDSSAIAFLTYFNGSDIAGVRAEVDNYRTIYMTAGLEQITSQAIRDTIVARSIFWLINGNVSGIENARDIILQFSLEQNYPNPFNPSTKIKYSVPQNGLVSIVVYDLTGQEVATLLNEVKEPGNYELDFNAAGLSSGVYFYRMTGNNFTQVKKLSILK